MRRTASTPQHARGTRGRRLPASLVVVAIVVLSAATEAFAYPGFARKYETSCNTCHDPVPVLNEFGRRFRFNGFQLPGTIEKTPLWEQDTLPLGFMTHEMGVNLRVTNNMAVDGPVGAGETLTTTSFRHLNLEVFSGGTLAEHLSYFVSWEIESEVELEDGAFESTTEIGFSQAFVAYTNVLNSGFGNLNFKMGLFELGLPFSQIRSITSHSNTYLAYDVAGAPGGSRLGVPQLGVSVYGQVSGFEYEYSLTNGTNGRFNTNEDLASYGRVAYGWAEPTDWLRVLRIGGLLWHARENLEESTLEPMNAIVNRFGADLELQFSTGTRVFGQYLFGEHNDTDPATNGKQPLRYLAAFVGINQMVIPEQLYAFGRVDWLHATRQWDDVAMVGANTGGQDVVLRYTVGVRWHFSPGTFLHLEFFQQQNTLASVGPANGATRVVAVDQRVFMLMIVATF